MVIETKLLIVSSIECSKLAQKEYKTWHDWVGKMIHWELCKKFKFGHTARWYTHKPEYVLENETHEIHRDFEIKTDHPILAWRPDLMIVHEKENSPNSGLCHPGRPQKTNKETNSWISRRSWRDSSERPPANAGLKNSQRMKQYWKTKRGRST